MAGRQGVNNGWLAVLGGFAVALAAETFVFLALIRDVDAWHVGIVALEAALMGVLAISPRLFEGARSGVILSELESNVRVVERRMGALENGTLVTTKTLDDALDALVAKLEGGRQG